MANVKFGKGEGKVAAEAPKPAPTEQSAESSYGVPAKQSFVVGDKVPEFNEIKLPRINLAHPVGNLGQTFPPGSVVFGQQVAIFVPVKVNQDDGNVIRPATKPAIVTVLGFKPTRYVEKVKFGEQALIVNTEADVRKNGGTLDYKEWEANQQGLRRFEVLADALVAVEKPEHIADDDTVFIFPVNDKKYAIAFWGLKGSSYTEAAKGVFFTQRQLGCLRQGYPTHSFYLSTRIKPKGKNQVWCPILLPAQKSTPEFIAFATQVLSGAVTPPPTSGTADDAGE